MKWPMAVSVVETGKTKTGLEKESKKNIDVTGKSHAI